MVVAADRAKGKRGAKAAGETVHNRRWGALTLIPPEVLLWDRASIAEAVLIAPTETEPHWTFGALCRLSVYAKRLPASRPMALDRMPVGVAGAVMREANGLNGTLTLRADSPTLILEVARALDPGLVKLLIGVLLRAPDVIALIDPQLIRDATNEAHEAPDDTAPVADVETPSIQVQEQEVVVFEGELEQVEGEDRAVEDEAMEDEAPSSAIGALPAQAPGLRWTETYKAWEADQLARLRARRAARLPAPPPPEPTERELMARAAAHRWRYEAVMREREIRAKWNPKDLQQHKGKRPLSADELELPMPDRATLQSLHHEQSASPLSIAVMYGVTDLLVYVWMDRLGIKLRSHTPEYLQNRVNFALGQPDPNGKMPSFYYGKGKRGRKPKVVKSS